MAHHVKDRDDFDAKLKDAGANLVVVDFFAIWCDPCKMIAPHIEKMAGEMSDVMFLMVDVDEFEEIAKEYGISSMPTYVFIKSGAQVDSFSGASVQKLNDTVQKHK